MSHQRANQIPPLNRQKWTVLNGSFMSLAHVSLSCLGNQIFNAQVFVFRVITPRSDGVLKLCYQPSDLSFSPHSTRGFQGNILCNSAWKQLSIKQLMQHPHVHGLIPDSSMRTRRIRLSFICCCSSVAVILNPKVCLFRGLFFLYPCSHCLGFTRYFKVVESFFPLTGFLFSLKLLCAALQQMWEQIWPPKSCIFTANT